METSSRLPVGTVGMVVIWFLAIGCVWYLMTVTDNPANPTQLLYLAASFLGAMYFLKRRRSAIGLLLWGALVIPMCLFAIPTTSTEKIKNVRALASAVSIESAINNFNSEYGTLPEVGNRLRTGSKEGFKLLSILLGSESSENLQNKSSIRFLAIKEGKNYKGGLMLRPVGTFADGLFDPWGNPYVVVLDARKEGKLHFNYGSKTVDLPGKLVAVFSLGKDGIEGNSDDVRTWGN